MLKPYIVYCGDPEEGALLVFAQNSKEAKKIGWRAIMDMFNCEFIHVNTKRIQEKENSYRYFMSLKKADTPHIVEPPACRNKHCTYWADDFDNLCKDCRENH